MTISPSMSCWADAIRAVMNLLSAQMKWVINLTSRSPILPPPPPHFYRQSMESVMAMAIHLATNSRRAISIDWLRIDFNVIGSSSRSSDNPDNPNDSDDSSRSIRSDGDAGWTEGGREGGRKGGAEWAVSFNQLNRNWFRFEFRATFSPRCLFVVI